MPRFQPSIRLCCVSAHCRSLDQLICAVHCCIHTLPLLMSFYGFMVHSLGIWKQFTINPTLLGHDFDEMIYSFKLILKLRHSTEQTLQIFGFRTQSQRESVFIKLVCAGKHGRVWQFGCWGFGAPVLAQLCGSQTPDCLSLSSWLNEWIRSTFFFPHCLVSAEYLLAR